MSGYQNSYANGQYPPSSRQYGQGNDHGYRQYDTRQNVRPPPAQYGQSNQGYHQSSQDSYQYAPAANSQQYYEGDRQEWNGGYDQYHPQDQYHAPPEPQRQFSYEQSPVELPRAYQYDERYHNRDARGPAQDNRSYGTTSPNRSRPGTAASNRSKIKKERILEENPAPKAVPWDNPFGVFPGTKKDIEIKKKEEEKSRKNAGTPSSRPPTSHSADPSPVSNEHISKDNDYAQHSAHSRDQHQHSQRPNQYDQPMSPTYSNVQAQRPGTSSREGLPADSRNAPPNLPSQRTELPVRPAPARNGTSSTLGRTDEPSQHRGDMAYGDRSQMQPPRDANNQYNDRDNGFRSPQDQGIYEMSAEPLMPPQNRFDYRRPSDPTSTRPRPNQTQDQYSYGAVSQNAIPSPPRDTAIPDFAAMAPGETEDFENDITLQRKPVYQKQTYQAPITTAVPPARSLKSPLDEFSFDLPQTNNSPAPMSPPVDGSFNPNKQSRPRPDNYQTPSPQDYRRGPDSGPGSYSQSPSGPFPPRSGSAVQSPQGQRSSFKHPYNQPPQRNQPPGHDPLPRTNTATSMNSYAPHQERKDYGNDSSYDRQAQQANYGYDQYGNSHDGRTQNGYEDPARDQYYSHDERERYDQGYQQYDSGQYSQQQGGFPDRHDYNGPGNRQHDPNRFPQTNGSRSGRPDQYGPGYGQYGPDQSRQQQQPPPRPRTAPGERPQHLPPAMPQGPGYNGRPGALTGSDAAHPVPIRPGLNQPTPSPAPAPAPAPLMPQTMQAQQEDLPLATGMQRRNADQKEAPVTIAELNNLREMFKNNPNNHGLGLKFAKRLVEAAKLLANEGGRADPKKTAQNRERYIFDAHKVVKKLVSAGSAEAMFYLADCYGQGLLGLESDPREAFNLYNSAAKLGHAQSAYRVAVCCELGQQGGGGTRRDHLKAVQYYKRAATMGDPPAMYKMGMIQLKGLLGQVPNPREGITWLKRAADRADEDNPHALFELGLLYESAKPTDTIVKDEAYARQLFYQAAELGYKYAQHRLGSCFEYGLLGCPIDPRQSIAWYTMAAKQGEHQSEFALSGWYLTGSPPLLEQNDQEAYLWARKAASSGLAKAEYAMGYYTEVGIGTNTDVEEAKRWYYRAAAQHHPKAKERLDELKRGGPKMQKKAVNRNNVGSQNEGECTVM